MEDRRLNDSQKPRQINLSKAYARRRGGTVPPAPRAPQRPAPSQAAENTAQHRVVRPNPAAAEVQRAAAAQAPRSAQPQAQARRPAALQSEEEAIAAIARRRAAAQRAKAKTRKKSKAPRIALTVVVVLLVLVTGGYIAVQAYGRSIINTGDMGTLDDVSGIIETPPEYKGKQLNLLVLGIDYSTEDAVVRDPIGNTDMILYCQFDFEKNTLKMLQIPRDMYVGTVGGASGKLNGVFAAATDTDKRVAAVAKTISANLKLPISNYVTIDMDSLREIVDLFGGVEVEIPYDIIDRDEKTGQPISALYAGTRNLMGAEAEFFLRARKMLPRGDIDRLENQRKFYAALFKRLRTATPKDLMKLIPVGATYVNSDLSVNDLIGVAINVLQISDGNIMMCKLPTYGGAERYKGKYDVIVCAKNESAELLNQYFFSAEKAITAADITFEDYPTAGGLYEPNVMWMGEHVEPDASAPQTDGAAASTAQPAA